MLILTQSEVERLLPVADCIEALRPAMIAVSAGEAVLPIRQFMEIPNAPGSLALMPGAVADPAVFGIKLVCKYVRPPDSPYGTHVGMVMLFDAVEGLPLAMLEGASLTAIRTSAASALATDALARPESARLAILGCGEQARRHVKAMQAVRQIEEIVVWGRSPEKAAAFAGELAQEGVARARSAVTVADAVSDADIVCATTSAKEPILFGADLPEGVHVNLVGSAIPTTAEADEDLVARSRFFVDYRTATLAAAGEFLRARDAGRVSDAHILAEIGEVLAGQAEGRTTPDDITVYKSLGVSAQDLAAGELVYKRAQDAGVGVQVDLTD